MSVGCMHIDALSLTPSLRTHMRTLGDEARITISRLLQDDEVAGLRMGPCTQCLPGKGTRLETATHHALERLDKGRRSRRGEKRMCVCVCERACVCLCV